MKTQRHSFPLEFQKVLVLYQTNYAHLSKAMERRGYKVSKQFLCQVGNGRRAVPPLQLSRICETLNVTEEQRRAMHLAACRDNGFYV